MKVNSPIDLLYDQLRDLYSMEIQLAASLPFLAESAHHEGLKEQLTKQANRTYRRKAQLVDFFRRFNIEIGTDKCKAIEGLIKGGDSHLANVDDPPTRDLMLIAHCLRIAHYGIAAYGITARLAQSLAFTEDASLLLTLTFEEEDAAQRLKHLEPSVFELAYRREKVS
jgi:ferritin-like metal-binding protein YciE